MERALLIHVRLTDRAYRDSWPVEDSARELEELARSAGLQAIDRISVNKDRPTPNLLVGKGKAQEIHERCHASGAQVVVFSEDLSFPQQRDLEELLGVKVIDRTQLILDIFAQRARSEEGKVQVELAQLEYLLPRLTGKGTLLSRLGGGIGTRGPGEQKLEMDRRRIRLRIRRLSRELELIHRRRGVARRKREEEEIPTLALIGYTNVGKSTLLRRLTQAEAAVRDQLFTTLDPLARRLVLPNRQRILLSDTVGFLHRLPHHLIDAFEATLEEVIYAQLLLHVLDASSPLLQEQAASVHEVLGHLKADGKPLLKVFNKSDRLSPEVLGALKRRHPDGVFISALTGEGIPELLDRLVGEMASFLCSATVKISEKDRRWLDPIYKQGQILQQRSLDSNVLISCRIPRRLYGQLLKAGLLFS